MLSPADFILNENDQDHRIYFQSSFEYFYEPYAFTASQEKPVSYSEWKYYDKSLSGDLSIEDTYTFLAKILFPHESLSGYNFFKNDLFLPGVRYISPGIVVFERPPMHQVVSYTPDYRDNITTSHSSFDAYLPIPWQVYVASYNPKDMRLISVKMFFANSSLYSETQPLYAPPLLNFYSNGELCRPFFPTTEDIEKYPQNITGIIASAYDWIWNSAYNLDITQNIAEYIYNSRYLQFEDYVKNTEAYDHFKWLQMHRLSNMSDRLNTQYLISFFKCWESIPLEDISNFAWASFSKNQFFYLDQSSSNSHLLQEYLELHEDIIVHEDEFGDDACHCEDCCPPECWTIDDIVDSSSYREFLVQRNLNIYSSNSQGYTNTLADAVQSSASTLASSRISQRIISQNFFYNNFVECGSLLSASS